MSRQTKHKYSSSYLPGKASASLGLKAPKFHNESSFAIRIHIERSQLTVVNVDLEDRTNHALVRLCLDSVPELCVSVPPLAVALFLVARLHYT